MRLLALLELMLADGQLHLDLSDEVLSAACVSRGNAIAEAVFSAGKEPPPAPRIEWLREELDDCMRRAAESFGAGVRRNATLRQLASEADGGGSLDQALEAYEAIGVPQLSAHERLICAKLYQRLGRDHAAVEILESARLAGTLSSEGRSLLFALHRQRARNVELAEALESGAARAPSGIAITRLREALRIYRDRVNGTLDGR